jgi:hypothetical protein
MKRMHRTQLYLSQSQHTALVRLATRRGVTLSEIVRRALHEVFRPAGALTAPRESTRRDGR